MEFTYSGSSESIVKWKSIGTTKQVPCGYITEITVWKWKVLQFFPLCLQTLPTLTTSQPTDIRGPVTKFFFMNCFSENYRLQHNILYLQQSCFTDWLLSVHSQYFQCNVCNVSMATMDTTLATWIAPKSTQMTRHIVFILKREKLELLFTVILNTF